MVLRSEPIYDALTTRAARNALENKAELKTEGHPD